MKVWTGVSPIGSERSKERLLFLWEYLRRKSALLLNLDIKRDGVTWWLPLVISSLYLAARLDHECVIIEHKDNRKDNDGAKFRH